jgi:hypothetical protein
VAVGGANCNPMLVQVGDGTQRSVCGPMSGKTSGMAILSSGLIGLALGIPLTVFGASDVPHVEGSAPDRPSSLSPRVFFALGLREASFAIKF